MEIDAKSMLISESKGYRTHFSTPAQLSVPRSRSTGLIFCSGKLPVRHESWVVNNIYYWFPVNCWCHRRWMERDWSTWVGFRLSADKRDTLKCCLQWNDLLFSARREHKDINIFIIIIMNAGHSCWRSFGIFSLIITDFLLLSSGWRWREMDLLAVSFYFPQVFFF